MSAPGFNSYFSGVSCPSTRQCRRATNRRMNIHEEQSSPSDRIESNLPGIIPVIHMARPRFHHSVTAIILIHALHAAATPAMVSAEGQEPRRHSLLHHSAVEATLPSATTHGTILQSSSDQPTRVTTPIEPPIAAMVPPAIELPYRRTSAKRPVMAPIPPAPIPHSAQKSDNAAGQDTPTTTEAGKSTIPTTAPPNTTSMTALPAGMASTNSHVATPPTPSPLAGAVHSTASGGGNTSIGSSRSTLNLFRNSAIASLLQPPTPVITIPPSPPPRSTPSSTSPPPNGSTGNVRLSWRANQEPDLAGYKLYIGTASGIYNFAGSPFSIDIATRSTAFNLPKGQTYYFALSAFDTAGNESVLSAEISKSLY
jgi:hypothetical protein